MLSSDFDIRRLMALRAVEAGLLRLKWLAAATRFELAMVRHERALKLACKYGYNPNQPRDELGKWTYDGGYVRVAGGSRSSGGGRSRYGGSFPGATHGQLIRLDQNIARTENALQQIRQYDPNWRPSTQSITAPGSVEGAIRDSAARATEAEARLQDLRTGIGGNFGPPLDPAPPQAGRLSSASFDGQAWINAYRTVNNAPNLLGQPSWPADRGTVAVTEIDGKIYFGVNSTAPTYNLEDWNTAQNVRGALIEKYPEVMSSDNIGKMPNNSLFHAEPNVLIRAADGNGGTLAGREIEIHTDRTMCDSCQTVLPYLARELGNPTVTIVDRTGAAWIIRDGVIGKIK